MLLIFFFYFYYFGYLTALEINFLIILWEENSSKIIHIW